MIRAIIFDCFGVLVGRGFDETYRHAGGDPQTDHHFINELLGQANRGKISHAEFHSQITGRLGITLEAYEQAVREVEQPNYELLNYIKDLRKSYKTAILSNVNAGVLERKIEEHWLGECFDVVVASAEEGFIKPEPQIYQLTAQKLGVDPAECVFVDDIGAYTQAAQKVGMRAIVYDDFVQMKRELDTLLTNANH